MSSNSRSFIIPSALAQVRSVRVAAANGSKFETSIDRRSLMLSIATGMTLVGVDGRIVNADQGTTRSFQTDHPFDRWVIHDE